MLTTVVRWANGTIFLFFSYLLLILRYIIFVIHSPIHLSSPYSMEFRLTTIVSVIFSPAIRCIRYYKIRRKKIKLKTDFYSQIVLDSSFNLSLLDSPSSHNFVSTSSRGEKKTLFRMTSIPTHFRTLWQHLHFQIASYRIENWGHFTNQSTLEALFPMMKGSSSMMEAWGCRKSQIPKFRTVWIGFYVLNLGLLKNSNWTRNNSIRFFEKRFYYL